MHVCVCLHVSQLSSRSLGYRSSNRAGEAAGVNAPGAVRRARTYTPTHTTGTGFQLVGLLIITTPSSHSHLTLYQKTLRHFPHQTRWPWGKGKKCLCQIRTPLPQGTQLITFAKEQACPAQLWLLPLPSNNHDLHALPVRPLLLPTTEIERVWERKREGKAIKGHRWVWDNTADKQRNRELFTYPHCSWWL